jgi:hypothetical protein
MQSRTTDELKWTRILHRAIAVLRRVRSKPFGDASVEECRSPFVSVHQCPSVVRNLFLLLARVKARRLLISDEVGGWFRAVMESGAGKIE